MPHKENCTVQGKFTKKSCTTGKKSLQNFKAIPLQKLKGLGNFLVAPRGYHTKGQAVLVKGGAD